MQRIGEIVQQVFRSLVFSLDARSIALPPSATGDHSYFGYMEVDDVDSIHAEFVSKGATILQAPIDRPYGMRELTVATPDGHRFVVGQLVA